MSLSRSELKGCRAREIEEMGKVVREVGQEVEMAGMEVWKKVREEVGKRTATALYTRGWKGSWNTGCGIANQHGKSMPQLRTELGIAT